jgi:hypothetical protein
MRSLLAAVWPVPCAAAQTGLDFNFLNYNRPTLHALTCYSFESQWADRIGRGFGDRLFCGH